MYSFTISISLTFLKTLYNIMYYWQILKNIQQDVTKPRTELFNEYMRLNQIDEKV